MCVSQQLCNAVMSWSADDDDDDDNNGRQQCDLSSGDMCLLRLFLLLSQLCPAVSGVWVLICLLKKSEVNLLSYSEHWAPLSSSFIFAARAALLAGVQVGFLFFSKVKAYGPMVCIQKTFIPYAKCFNSNICVWSVVETPAYLHE